MIENRLQELVTDGYPVCHGTIFFLMEAMIWSCHFRNRLSCRRRRFMLSLMHIMSAQGKILQELMQMTGKGLPEILKQGRGQGKLLKSRKYGFRPIQTA